MDFANAFCGDGSATGLGINPSPTNSTRVLIYLEGGGACASLDTCYTFNTASHFTTGYNATTFQADVNGALSTAGGFFDRNTATNPFKDYNFVFVPYCTGDVFSGNHVQVYDSTHSGHHVGFANMTAFLARIAATFPGADRVILAGSSAGGFGALLNWEQAQRAFGTTRVDMLDDSGTLMPPDINAQAPAAQQTLAAEASAWGFTANLPAACTACATNLDAIIGFYQTEFPTHRAAFLSYSTDTVLPAYEMVTPAQFTAGLTENEAIIQGNASQRYFVSQGSGHVLFAAPTLTVGTTSLATWLTQFVTDSTAWTNLPSSG